MCMNGQEVHARTIHSLLVVHHGVEGLSLALDCHLLSRQQAGLKHGKQQQRQLLQAQGCKVRHLEDEPPKSGEPLRVM